MPEPVGALVADVSFISLTKALPVPLTLAHAGAWLVALIKPQFEAGRAAVGKRGIVRDAAARQRAVDLVRDWFAEQPDWRVLDVIASPILGGSGNQEFLLGASVAVKAQDVEIDWLGAQGDGVVELPGEPLYIRYALPGELWRFVDDKPPVLLRPHAARAEPVCRHFGTCGGCDAQHMADGLYAAWKRAIVVDAFRHRALDAPVDDLFRVPLASRRRIQVYARRYRKNLHLGFYRPATHDIMDVIECPIAKPQLVAALPALREMLEPLLTGQAEAAIHMLATPAGVDVHMGFDPSRLARQALSAFGRAGGATRLGPPDDRA